MSEYAHDFLFLRAELENCRVKNAALEYRLWGRLQGMAEHIIGSGFVPWPEHLL